MAQETDSKDAQDARVYTCEYCGEEFDSSVKKARHIGSQHKEETQARKEAEQLAVKLGGLSPQEFAEALDAAAPDLNARTRKQMLLAYDDDSDALSGDRKALEDFLDDYGLRRKQQRQIVRQLFGVRRDAGSAVSGIPGMGFQAIQTPWGQMPAIIINRGQEDERVATVPWTPPGGESAEQARREARLEGRLERLEETIADLKQALSGGATTEEKGERGPPPMRRVQRPVFDSEGNLVYEAVEEP